MNYVPVAVVTGATRGIGRAIASLLSRKGLACVLIGSSAESVRRVRVGEQLHFTHPFQKHRALAIDLARWPEWTGESRFWGVDFSGGETAGAVAGEAREGSFRLFPGPREQLWETPGAHYFVSLLVNCAGVSQHSLSVRTGPAQIQRIMNLNFASCVSLSNLAAKQMLHTVRQRVPPQHCVAPYVSPCIVNISSVLGAPQMAIPGTTVYAASKAALSQYTRVLTQEVTSWGVRAACLEPGLVSGTDMTNELGADAQRQLVDGLIGLPTQTPEDVAAAVWQVYVGENAREDTQ